MSIFQKRFIKTSLVPCTLTALFFNTMPAVAGGEPTCPTNTRVASVQGTASNNALGSGESVGVIQVVVQGKGMMRCGIHGVLTGPGSFIDTLVCDDQVAIPNSTDTVHSQLVTNTQFVPPTALQACASPAGAVQGSISELSDPAFGRGAFSSAGGGRLYIQGTINCSGVMELSFYGNVCVVK